MAKIDLNACKSLSTKQGVSGSVSTNTSGSKYLTFYVNTPDKKISDKRVFGFCAGVESKITPETIEHALLTAYACRNSYDEAKLGNKEFDSHLYFDWRKRFIYAPEKDGTPTPFGLSTARHPNVDVDLKITGGDKITSLFGRCIADAINGSVIKCKATHAQKGAKAISGGKIPLTFTIGDGCEVV